MMSTVNDLMMAIYVFIGSAFAGSFITLLYKRLQNNNNGKNVALVFERIARLEERTQKIEDEIKEIKTILFQFCSRKAKDEVRG